jgi:hypothetical protein
MSRRKTIANNIEFRIMPSGDGSWYWEVIEDGRSIVQRGVASTQPGACAEAHAAAETAGLIC